MIDDALRHDLERATGSPQLAKAVREQITRLSRGAGGPVLAELARDLLDGRTDLRSVTRGSAYAEPLSEVMSGFARWHDNLEPEERERLIRGTEAYVASLDVAGPSRPTGQPPGESGLPRVIHPS
jgi:hypothetical protein